MKSFNVNNNPKIPLAGGILAAIGASLCCAGPLILLLLGVSGSWIGNLTILEPFRPFFIFIVIFLLVWAGWIIHRPTEQCTNGSVCENRMDRKRYQYIFWIVTGFSIFLMTSPYWITLWF